MPDPPRDDLVAYGAYLAKLGHCVQCHTAVGSDGRRDYVNHLGAGGLSVDVAWGSRVSANITPDPKTGIGTWTDDQIIAALSHGTRPSGESLSTIMPWPYWQTMKRDDLLAIVAWLRTLTLCEVDVLTTLRISPDATILVRLCQSAPRLRRPRSARPAA